MDASDVIRRRQQLAQYIGYKVVQSREQPTVPFSTPCTFYASTVIHNFTTYDAYNNIRQGLLYSVSSCT